MILTVAEKLRRLKPLMNESECNNLWSLYQIEDNPRGKKEIESWIDMLFLQKTESRFEHEVILPPPAEDEANGDIEIGKITYCKKTMYPFSLRKDELLRHVGLFGQTGSGKTTACMNLLKQFMKQKIPFLIFDWKRNYRDLLTDDEIEKNNIEIYTVGRNLSPFSFNPKIAPPNTDFYTWQKKLVEIIEKAYLLGPGASDVFMDAMGFSNFAEMKRYVDKQNRRGREMLWLASAKRTLNSLNFPGLSEVVNGETQIPIPELLNKNVILELDALSDTDKTFLIGSLLLYIYFYRMNQPEREILKHIIVIEEAHHLLLKTSREEDITDVIMREIRELGEGIVILDQHPHKISVSALGSCFTKIGFGTTLSQDIMALAKSMSVMHGEEFFFGILKIGEVIVKSGRVSFPFSVSVPKINIKKGIISDDFIKTHMMQFSVYSRINPDYSAECEELKIVPETVTLSPPELIMLENIAQDPFIGVKDRYKKLGLSPREGTAIIEELVKKRVIIAVTVDRTKLFDITLQANELLLNHGIKIKQGVRGGVLHNYWVEKIGKKFAGNSKVNFEKDNIDLVIESDDKKIAVEVETGKSDLKKNLESLEKYHAEKKFMIATNPETLARIRTLITGPGVQTYLAKDFIEKIIPIILTEK